MKTFRMAVWMFDGVRVNIPSTRRAILLDIKSRLHEYESHEEIWTEATRQTDLLKQTIRNEPSVR